MVFLSYIFTPLLCAAIGYSTNWLAISMLFRPHRPIMVGRYRLPFTPGLIPKERERLANKVAETVSRHVLTPEVLAREFAAMVKNTDLSWLKDFNAEQFINGIRDALEDNPPLEIWLTDMVRKIIQEHVGRFVSLFLDPKKIYASIREGLFDYISDPVNQAQLMEKIEGFLNDGHAPPVERLIEKVSAYIAESIPIRQMIENKLNAFSVEEAERLILSVVSRELHLITALGGVLGFIIGLVSLLVP